MTEVTALLMREGVERESEAIDSHVFSMPTMISAQRLADNITFVVCSSATAPRDRSLGVAAVCGGVAFFPGLVYIVAKLLFGTAGPLSLSLLRVRQGIGIFENAGTIYVAPSW